ncbi:MAG: hypothetical protein NVS3B16_09640 [Vulcanimicrobiaceae bacterium]
MNNLEILVPLAAIFCLFGLPVIAFVAFRVLAHRERMAMIRGGFAPGKADARVAYAAQPYSSEAAHTTLRKGITLSFIGFAITLGLSFIGLQEVGGGGLPGSWHPGPWLIGGLVPLFVGLAQVVIALLSGATLRPMTMPAAPYVAEQASPAANDPPTFDGPYTYRPGATQELRPPRTPPERRS